MPGRSSMKKLFKHCSQGKKFSFLVHPENTSNAEGDWFRKSSFKKCVNFAAESLIFGSLLLLVNGVSTIGLAYSRGMAEELSVVDNGGNGGDDSGSGITNRTDDFDNFGGEDGSILETFGKGEDENELPRVTIIVPAVNEQKCIKETLKRIQNLVPKAHRVIVADGGSSDETIKVAEEMGAVVIKSKRGRSIQLNTGAELATKSNVNGILCFVHADTIVPVDLVSIVRKVLSKQRIVCGGFVPIMTVEGGIYWGLSLRNVLKTWFIPLTTRPVSFFLGFRWLFGDQVMFCRASDFHSVGGFDESLPIMEDVNLCEKLHLRGPKMLKGRGHIKLVNRSVMTSGRRMKAWGFLRATFIYFLIGFHYALGAPASEVLKLYRKWYADVR